VTLANNRSRLFRSGFPNKFVVGEMADRCFGNADDDDDDDGIEVIIAVDLSSRRRGCG
jgi:hypothetical protein